MQIVTELIVGMAPENPPLGFYPRIQALSTIWDTRWDAALSLTFSKREGIEPAPERSKRTPWAVFLKSHWGSNVAAEVLTAKRAAKPGSLPFRTYRTSRQP